MKIKFNLKDKFPSIEFCYNNKVVIVRYWGRLKFDKVIIYNDMEKNSMTAVEWFWILLPENISKEHFDLFEQAKQMEKEQIMNARLSTFDLIRRDDVLKAEQYYNETYGK